MFDVTGNLRVDKAWDLVGRFPPIITNVSVEGGDVVTIGRFLLYELGYNPRKLEIGDEVVLGGHSFILVEEGFGDYFIGVYIRDWSSKVRSRLYRWFKPLTEIKYRVIMTCQLWKVASIPHGAVPIWRNIHLVNKIYSWITQIKGKIYPRFYSSNGESN